MQDMLDAYFDDIKNTLINKKIQEEKEERLYLASDKKAPKPAAETLKKPAEDSKKPEAAKRLSSTTPKPQT